MTTFTAFMKCVVQGYGDLMGRLFLVTTGALAPLSIISIEVQLEIMMTRSAANDCFMEVMVKHYRWSLMFAEFSAFQYHGYRVGFLGAYLSGNQDAACDQGA
jgi:hypothetical protein